MAPRARAYWKGYLRLSLVSIGVELYAASVSGDKTALHQIHKPSGKRVRYEKVAPGVGPVDASDIVKGFEIGDDAYVVLEPEDLDEIKLESGRAIELVQFVDRDAIDPRYFEKPYYLTPEGDVSTEGYVVIREALQSTGRIGLGRLTMRGRESLVAVVPLGKGLVVETLRYANELRAAEPYFSDIGDAAGDEEMIALAKELIERKTRPFDAAAFKDSYAEALRALVESKREGHAIVSTGEEERRGPGKVIDLIEALKRSVGEAEAPAPRRAGQKPAPARDAGRAKPAAGGKKTAAKKRA
ncbi:MULTISPECIES: Ku protein [Methylosinus]|uniref:Non-homologous end joining protein Ku n=1 Tax=Methylosinus trichosporium (strain ATCC 35070 / NCIMB 11131 / UNIQEM 75 / OB3b) TaxID=595536 RepID=A0A2D2CWJ5_METT3|nr:MULTISPECIES: Ku protein [Methylosinus]ATQ67046.1 Ku protein [Methylosinus trichosporium OB3b]OBS50847.1 Ku protein [Methylosinus sp. 3S-1]